MHFWCWDKSVRMKHFRWAVSVNKYTMNKCLVYEAWFISSANGLSVVLQTDVNELSWQSHEKQGGAGESEQNPTS